MKVSKEDVIGCLAAVEYWFETRDPAAELRRWRADVQTIVQSTWNGLQKIAAGG